MIKCEKCKTELKDSDVLGWKCLECGKAFKVHYSKLKGLRIKKSQIEDKDKVLLKCPSCGKDLDNGNELLVCKCGTCGNLIKGNLKFFVPEKPVKSQESDNGFANDETLEKPSKSILKIIVPVSVVMLVILVAIIVVSKVGNVPKGKYNEDSDTGIANETIVSTEAITESEKIKEPTYFEECDFLPTPASCSEVHQTGSHTSSLNGLPTQIKYTFSSIAGSNENILLAFQNYSAYLINNGFSIEKLSDTEFTVKQDNIKIADVTNDGTVIDVEIVPMADRIDTTPEQKSLGDSIQLDFVSMSLDSINISDEIYPEETNGAHLYIKDTEGSKYVYLKGKIKNLGTVNINSYHFNGQIIINDTYSYYAELIIAANPISMTDYAITPFEEATYYLYANIPDDAIDIFNKGIIFISFNDNFEEGSGENCTYNYSIPFVK